MAKVQFFVRLLCGRTIVLATDSSDTIRFVLEKIQSRTEMIDPFCLRLIYQGKQLGADQTLKECGVDNDSELKLVCRVRSTTHPNVWRLVNDLVHCVVSLCENPPLPGPTRISVRDKLYLFLDMWKKSKYLESQFLEIFVTCYAPQALVRLYMSSHMVAADDAIRLLVSSINVQNTFVLDSTERQCVLIVLELCKLLGSYAGSHDPLYKFCRGNLRVMVGKKDMVERGWPFAEELAIKMSRDLPYIFSGPSLDDVKDFRAVLDTFLSLTEVPFDEELSGVPAIYKKNITYFRGVFHDLLNNFDEGLERIEENIDTMLKKDTTMFNYLTIFEQLNMFSKLYCGRNKIFLDTMKRRKRAISYLIVKYWKRSTHDITCIFDCKELMEFEAKRHLALMMLPELNNNRVAFQILIDRSQLLAQSFEYIAKAHPDSLRAGLFVRFMNETASGPSVLHEWFVLVCEEIFNPHNALFMACSNDRRRFLPNPASMVNPRHLQYFRFCGRVIALALTCRIHIGVVLDRAFFLQLAGHNVLLEDIRDADPFLYKSCKQILDMDAEIVDQDVLGLTFVHEVEKFGKREKVELCAGGKSMVVNSKNRMQYVDSLIQLCFVTSIGQQVEHFGSGFADIASPELQKSFFKCLDPEDLDKMLRGSENLISVDDWRTHTDYHGFEKTDSQISWFWEIVGDMTEEQKKILLFFWTSIKYLPIEGFRGLSSRLQIHKTGEPPGRLPVSYTCFYQLCFPSYPSLAITRDRLGIITQKHVGYSFGKS